MVLPENELMEIITFVLGWVGKWLHSLITKKNKKHESGTGN